MSLLQPLLTHEVGSLAKPSWRVKGQAGHQLSEAEIEEARRWGERLGVADYERLLSLLRQSPLDAEGKRELGQWASRYAMRLFESAGLDVIYDGEQQRSEMYAWTVAHVDGFDFRGSVRSFDNKYYSKAAVTGPLSLQSAYHDEEFMFARSVADSPLKVPVTGAYTIAVWSFDERHRTPPDLNASLDARRRATKEARRQLVIDIARHVIRPNVESLLNAGAEWIQIDEPGASTEPEELDLFVEGFNATVEGLDATFSTHLCFSDYNLFFPAIERMTGCQQYAVGFANDDRRDLGTGDEARPGYQVIRRFRDLPYQPALGLGVVDIHTDFVEPPELVRDRVLHAVEVFGGPERIHVMPDCGLRTRSWDIAHEKLASLVAGVAQAEKQLGLS